MAVYVDEHLLQGEKVCHRAKMAPVAAFMPAIVVAVASFAVGFVFALASGLAGGALIFFLCVLCEVFAIPAGLLRMRFNEFAVTNRRVIAKVGAIRTHSMEINLNKVEGIAVRQNIPGRLFGFGSIVVTGTGGSHDPFSGIERPFDFRKAVQTQIDRPHRNAR